ncbi:gluconate 2-dehydrogenase subunit 3 family protein [Cellulophaga omnivescoria]|uniref:gluconate 2-dehydrogenase subunit 3 family protein n=1 Tax=Cellulophaga omnivescoria TaxID=1888890 RepID=UPI000985837A|nr:gluconate 2-dehydrogenase subunit 3 family protein [Cellulophaga omnivescoria]WBU90992.1 gluconate 2-dehydrogenase subunit 3 family protein [Cellulophaga omnivescoria]
MNRRLALKNLGLSLGYVVATPTLISIVQSCKNDKGVAFTPEFFSQEEGDVVVTLMDIILPKTDSPSASEANVHMFVDQYINVSNTAEEKALFKAKMASFLSLAKSNSKKEAVSDITAEELENTLASCLKLSEEQIKQQDITMRNYNNAIANGEVGELDVNSGAIAFAQELRGWTIRGYKATEEIAKNFLAFDPIPGKYVPCGTIDEFTGGKAWAL